MEKVKITRKQADLLDGLLDDTNINWILSQLADWHNVLKSTKEMAELHHLYVSDPLTFSKALVIGYEVEETPEDKVKAHWNELLNNLGECHPENIQKTYLDGQMRGISKALDLLGIKIEGIN